MKTEESMSIELVIQQTPTVALLDPKKKEELYVFLEREIEVFVPDLSTETSRKKIAALAYKVARTKTAIDDAGAELKAEWLKKSQAIDLSRREIREKLDALKEKARKPLTDWEVAETERVAFCSNLLGMLEASPLILATDTSETVERLLAEVEAVVIEPAVFREGYDSAAKVKASSVLALKTSIGSLKQKEADALELARLRTESEARAAADKEAARVAEAARVQKEADERRLAEEKRQIEIAQQAKERHAAELEEAKVRATKEAEDRVKREQEAAAKKVAVEHAAEVERMRKEAAEAESLRIGEERRLAAEETIRKQEEARRVREIEAKAEADRKAAANKKNRKAIMDAASLAMIEATDMGGYPVKEECADQIVRAIVDGKIPMCSLRFS